MANMNAVLPTEVTVGETTVSFKRTGQTSIVLAHILGVRTDPESGAKTLWLDRLVHKDGEKHYGWTASGAISTVLRQVLAQPAQAHKAS